jgi:hypothetical protein
MANIIFWAILIINVYFTFHWIFRFSRIGGTLIVPIFLTWIILGYFYKYPDVSRYHLLWVMPVMFLFEIIVIGYLYSLIMRLLNRDR